MTDEEDNGEANTTGYTSPVFVHGTFKPVTTRFTGCTLVDGAKIDLSECVDTFDVVSTTKRTQVPHTLLFAEDARIGVVLGQRRVRNGEKLIAWAPSATDEPAVKAVFTTEKRPDILLEVRADGLYAISNSTIIFFRRLTRGAEPRISPTHCDYACESGAGYPVWVYVSTVFIYERR